MNWVIPTIAYMLCVGGLGVTGKLALRTLHWPDLILWTGAGYVVAAGALLALGSAHVRLGVGTPWAVISAIITIGGLIALYLALNAGDASKVVAFSAGYPAVTLVLSAMFLSEPVTPARVAGLALVVAGVVLLAVSH